VIAARQFRARTVSIALFLFAVTPAAAQQDTVVATLKPVVVTVTRGSGRTILGSPFAISVIHPDSARPGQRHVSMDEALALIPGVASVSRNNPAQDPRLSIRGFGARSAFGVRGVRMLRDGIPMTLPDGQTPVDYVSLESVGQIEVLRGAASALYGNASGGVIDLRSREPSTALLDAEAKQWFGSDAMSRSVLSFSGTPGRASYLGDVTHARTDGSRVHSAQRGTTGFARVGFRGAGFEFAVTGMGLDNPIAENPGALTIDEMRDDSRMSDVLSLRRNARKVVTQIQIGASARRATSSGEVSFSAYGGARSLDNPLTFAVVEVGRHTWGGSTAFRARRELSGAQHSFAAGLEVQTQNDLRKNLAVCADTVPLPVATPTCPVPGHDRGILTLAQRELVSSAGVYIGDDIQLSNRFTAAAAVRADRVRFEVEDDMVSATNPDDSGVRTLGAISPVVGVIARIGRAHSVYSNFSTAFETPTATELGNHADGTAGINPDLDPQHSHTIEAGAKGWAGANLRYDVALFDTRVKDELVPFEIAASSGRRYFRNAGRTRRQGAEAGAEVSVNRFSLLLAYSYSRFRFTTYESGGMNFAGNRIPGIPCHRLQSALRVRTGKAFVLVENEVSSSAFADDANIVRAPGYAVTNGRLGSEIFLSRARATVVVGVQNLFDRVYASSLAVNASRGKYYEPASRRSLFAGVSLGTRPSR
jgi:iron complex outermembrane recepter protein